MLLANFLALSSCTTRSTLILSSVKSISPTRLMRALSFLFALTVAVLALPLASAPLKIACIGDSITEGAGLGNATLESYPARLQRLLGTNHVVRNYGVSGRTLLKQGDYPYWNEAKFKQSHDWNPDLVLIMLGTNDAKPYNWKYGTNFIPNLEELIASYADLPSLPDVVLCIPCPVYKTGAFDIRPGTVATNVVPAIRDVAARLELAVIDLHSRLAGHPEWFPDTVHPNSKGMAAMTAVVFASLFGTPAPTDVPSLAAQRISPTRLVLEWPAQWGGLMVQSAPAFGPTNVVWTVAETVLYQTGDRLRQTNTISSGARFFRLTQP